ncbi:MAG: hypothetical protein WAO58_00455 [Fimbriimonadaceae bacterium]
MRTAILVLAIVGLFAGGAGGQWNVINLHPAGANSSYAYGVSEGQQVGEAEAGGIRRAGLWSGTADSWVDLRSESSPDSRAYGVHRGQQAGYITVGGYQRASLWTGTDDSWVNLHPDGATNSQAYGVGSGQQVGWTNMVGWERASLWSGTAASWVDMHALLPSGFSSSTAQGICQNAVFTYVVGNGFNTISHRTEALMWRAPTKYLRLRSAPPPRG